tara:strand:- start:44 stop:481 length:438 start_codon:yes stop_codon:yes gene_type:complete
MALYMDGGEPFDRYEFGTCEPYIDFTSVGGITQDSKLGWYTIIADLLYFDFFCQMSESAQSPDAGAAALVGFPVNSADISSSRWYVGECIAQDIAFTSGADVSVYIGNNTSTGRIHTSYVNGGAALDAMSLSDNDWVRGSICYRI